MTTTKSPLKYWQHLYPDFLPSSTTCQTDFSSVLVIKIFKCAIGRLANSYAAHIYQSHLRAPPTCLVSDKGMSQKPCRTTCGVSIWFCNVPISHASLELHKYLFISILEMLILSLKLLLQFPKSLSLKTLIVII